MRLSGSPKLLPLSFLFFTPVLSELRNITVDDQFGDPITGLVPEYLPEGLWNIGSPTEDCGCEVNPGNLDLYQVYNSTWHDATHLDQPIPQTITVNFTGSAVYVFNIIPNIVPDMPTALVNITFYIDGLNPSTFIHQPDANESEFMYHQLVYQNTALEYGPHTLTMSCNPHANILFDYLTYTTQTNITVTNTPVATASSPASTLAEAPQSSSSWHPNTPTSSPSSSSGTPVGAIAGGAIGGVILLLGVALGAFLFGRERMRSKLLVHPQLDYARADGGPPDTTLFSATHRITPGLYDTDTHDVSREVLGRPLESPVVAYGALNTELTQKRRRELARRLEALQRTARSVFSSQATASDPWSDFRSEGGMTEAVRGLEAEISQLRNVLATWNAVRLADVRNHAGHDEPLPEYAH